MSTYLFNQIANTLHLEDKNDKRDTVNQKSYMHAVRRSYP